METGRSVTEVSMLSPSQYLHFLARPDPIGAFAATRNDPATATSFSCWLSVDEEQFGEVELGNIVAVVTNNDVVFGVIEELTTTSEIPDMLTAYMRSNFGRPEAPSTARPVTTMTARCGVLRSLRDLARPISNGLVYLASPAGIEFALDSGADRSRVAGRIPIGVLQNTKDVWAAVRVDERYLLGPNAAHINISGMSGEAAKTSMFLTLLKSVFTHAKTPTAAVIINNKSADLLALDFPNPELTEDDRALYEAMDVPPEPFDRVRYFGPKDGERLAAKTLRRNQAGQNDARPFCWELLDTIDRDHPSASPLLELLDESYRDDRAQAVLLDMFKDLLEGAWKGIATFDDWNRELAESLEENKYKVHAEATVAKVRRGLASLVNLYEGLIGGGQTLDIPFEDMRRGEVFVIDIAQLGESSERAQRFILAHTLRRLRAVLKRNRATNDRTRPRAVIVFIDELNKFCPATGDTSALKKSIIDVYARGRSIGLIGASAEQLMSQVDREVIANTTLKVFGRTDTAETLDRLYSEFSEAYREKLRSLRQGTRMVKFRSFARPLFVKCGRPPCASGDTLDLLRELPSGTVATTTDAAHFIPDDDTFLSRFR